MEPIEKSKYQIVPCIKSCQSHQSFSGSKCLKQFRDFTKVDAVEEIDNTCDCVADYACQSCESEGSENDCSTSEKIVNCIISEETEKSYDCRNDNYCPGCESKYSHEIPQNDSLASETILNCTHLGVEEEFAKSDDRNINKNCPGCKPKYSHEFSQSDLSTTETLVNCTKFVSDEEICNNYDCKVCEGCKIKDSLEDGQKDRPSSEKIGDCELIDVEEEIAESYDCTINTDCLGCEIKSFHGNHQNDWPIPEKMSAKDGLKCVKKMMRQWKNDRAMRGWKFYAEFIGMDSDGASDFYSYQVRWSFPTHAYPEPQVTVSVFFTVEAPHNTHRKCPVDVTYVFEGNQFAHGPKMPFRPKWIYDVLDIKTMMFKSFKF